MSYRRIFVFILAITALSGCGGGGYRKAIRDTGPTMRLASGPISRACLASDRKARSTTRCGCIQAVANDTLSANDQRLAAGFYGDPHRAQVIRQSDRASHERFWRTYKDYAETASAICGSA